MPANSTLDRPVITRLSVLCILVEILSRAHAKRGKSLNNLESAASVGHFLSDGVASAAVKGLRSHSTVLRMNCVLVTDTVYSVYTEESSTMLPGSSVFFLFLFNVYILSGCLILFCP